MPRLPQWTTACTGSGVASGSYNATQVSVESSQLPTLSNGRQKARQKGFEHCSFKNRIYNILIYVEHTCLAREVQPDESSWQLEEGMAHRPQF